MLRTLITALMLGLILSSAQAAPLKIGDKVPNFELVDQNGRKVSFNSFKGKGIIVSFLYTRCPYPDKCPMIGQKLADLALLIDKTGQKDKLAVMAITLDPAYDKPEVLKAYTHGFDAARRNWSFLTGTEELIKEVASAFGVVYWTDKGIVEHNMRTAFIDPQGRLQIVKTGADWKAGEFAAEIKAALK